ncbi:FAD binding domain-containing protein [Hansschlegelia quercus]|uniref:Xanthine dehydrogenase family protein subunit M n=1 Tax=Hansschlegelia quercus TaxID=2528245 RepID=A0A4Q9GLR2_9HYPH|nr:FAD binding domain-containing protein [Hansschlegelia quercus]TBN55228.1 xanthine dehydrogenase family protein subunit M [Hansschlegelia quercus]
MIPLDFDYARPASVDEALGLLAKPGAVALAGGQSLLPMLADRSVSAGLVVDIGRLPDLKRIDVADGLLTIGAAVTLTAAMCSKVSEAAPLLSEAILSVGSAAVRNRGTLVGNLVRASPNSELPSAVVALGATLALTSLDGERTLAAEDFFLGAHETALAPGELVTALRIPTASPNASVSAFGEISSRAGAPPLCCVAVDLRLDGTDIVAARIVAGGLANRPLRCSAFEAALFGSVSAVSTTLKADVALPDSSDGPAADYARDVLPVLIRRTVARAVAKIEGSAA